MRVAIVTPTIGNAVLKDCLDSVQSQTYTDICHYIFIDGKQYDNKSREIIEGVSKNIDTSVTTLNENIGNGWYGHRVYAACSFLVNADLICYLDEDNWIEPNHIQKLVEEINNGSDWAYSLRKIYDKDKNFICDDNCESLGLWPTFQSNTEFHIDTSSFCLKRDVAVAIGHSWYGKWGADRQFFYNLRKYFNNYSCSKEYSLCYRLDGNPNSVKADFFIEGNKRNNIIWKGEFPWKIKNKFTTFGGSFVYDTTK